MIDQPKYITNILAARRSLKSDSSAAHLTQLNRTPVLLRTGVLFFTSQLIQFSYILLLGNLLCQKSVLQFLSLHYLSVPLIRCNPAPPLTGFQTVVDPAILLRSGFGLLLFLFPFMSPHLPAGLAARFPVPPGRSIGYRILLPPETTCGNEHSGVADFRQPFPCTDPCTESW